jgi:hypothetical protein
MIAPRSVLAAALLSAMALAGPALGAEAAKISVEFNDLQQAEGGCRAVFVLNNGLDKALDGVTLKVVTFDKDDHAKLFLSLEVGALPIGKTRIVRFDLGEEMACADVGRIVLDDVTRCEGADIDPPKCLAAIALATRAGVPFDF